MLLSVFWRLSNYIKSNILGNWKLSFLYTQSRPLILFIRKVTASL